MKSCYMCSWLNPLTSWKILFGWLIIAKILLLQHNQHFFTLTFRSLSETFIRRSLFNSSSGSCHDSDGTWQDISRTCGSACSSPHPGSMKPSCIKSVWAEQISTWSAGQPPLFWTENPTNVLDGSKRQYIFEKKDGSHWTGTRGATRWATSMTDFLPRRITIVARTGRGIEQTSSNEGLC